jgi:hypothetical protein
MVSKVDHQKMTPDERERWLRTFDELVARIPPRAAADVAKEQADIRRSRRMAWRSRANRRKTDQPLQ